MKLFRSPGQFQRHVLPFLLGCAIGLTCVAGHAQDKGKAGKFYEDALVRYEKKDLPGTIIQLKNALQIDPTMLPVQLLLGKALMQNGEVVAAEVALNEALRLGVNRAEIVLLLGRSYLVQGKPAMVLESASLRTAGLPPDTQLRVHLLRGEAHASLGNVREALRAIEEARAIDSRSLDVWLAEVPIRIRARQFKEANDAADKALALSVTSTDAMYQKGSTQHVQGDLRRALAAYDRVIQIDANHVEARVARIGIYMDTGRFAEASKDVMELRRLAPDEPRGAYLRALLAEREGNSAEANTALKEVTDLLDPIPIEFIRFRPQVLMLNGLAHFGLNQGEKAKQYLEAFQKVQGNSPTSKLLARLYLVERNPAQAVTVLETYLKAQPGDGQALTLLASAHMALGRNAKATALMQEALKTQDNPAFRTALGMSLVGGGQMANGIAELEAAYKKDARQTPAASALIQLYLRAGQPRKAVPVAENLVKLRPTNANFHNLLGMALGQTGNMVGARAAFEKALQLNGNLTAAKLNLARLEIATKALDVASSRLNEVLRLEPKNGEAMLDLAVIAEKKGQQIEAQRWLEKARDNAGPKELRGDLALVDFHLRYARVGPALEAAKQASSKAPEDLTTLLAYSRAQLANGDTTGAKSTLTGATRFAEYNAPLQVEIARLQLAANNLPGAAYSLEKALANRPDFLLAQALMAEVEIRKGELAKAEKRARDLVVQHPKLAVGHGLLGDISLARGQSAAAIDSYRRAHAAAPSTITIVRLFQALSSQAQAKPAIQLAEQWVASHPGDLPVHKVLAEGYRRAGNFAASKIAYEKALKVKEDDAEALNNLANVQLRLKDQGAVKTAERAVASAPGNAITIDTLGWVLVQNGQLDRGLQLLRDARLRQPDNPEIRYHLAAALAQSGRTVEAKSELDAALQGNRAFEGRSNAESLAQTLK